MAHHLDHDVAAFVDGQLSDHAMADARRHLADCERCSEAVIAQRHLKMRMQGVGGPTLSADFLRQLSELPDADFDDRESRWRRLVSSSAASMALAMTGASMVVIALAYGVGGPPDAGDPVRVSYDSYVRDFDAGFAASDSSMPADVLQALGERGWPCHTQLGSALMRVDGRDVDDSDAIAILYTDGIRRLMLVEQPGQLVPAHLGGFAPTLVDGHRVWVRDVDIADSSPPRAAASVLNASSVQAGLREQLPGLIPAPGPRLVVTWDADGIVYTMVTDAPTSEVDAAVTQLPKPTGELGASERIRDGFDRIAAFMSAA